VFLELLRPWYAKVLFVAYIIAVAFIIQTFRADAATGGYPWHDAPCRYAAGGTSCINPSNADDKYNWYADEDRNDSFSGESENNDPWGYWYRNCVSYVAWKLDSLGVADSKFSNLGSAKYWVNVAKRGILVNTVPATGAVAVDTSTSWGHVAFIESYHPFTKEIVVSEYNRERDGAFRNGRKGTLAELGFEKVLHFEELYPKTNTSQINDFNGDSKSDMLLYGPGDNADRVMYAGLFSGEFSPTGINGSFNAINSEDFIPVRGDFDANGNSDVFLYRPGTGSEVIMAGSNTKGELKKVFDVTQISGKYTPIPGDFNGDKKSDILLYGSGDAPDRILYAVAGLGVFDIYTINGTSNGIAGSGFTPIPGDFNGDRESDVYLYRAAGTDELLLGTDTMGKFTRITNVTQVNGNYAPVAGDFDGAGKSDILFYGSGDVADRVYYATTTTGQFAEYTVNGTANGITGAGYNPVPGDFNNDGNEDCYLYRPGTGSDALLLGTDTKGKFTKLIDTTQIDGTYTPVK
jgi:surface antigen